MKRLSPAPMIQSILKLSQTLNFLKRSLWPLAVMSMTFPFFLMCSN